MARRWTVLADLLTEYADRRDTNAREIARALDRAHAGVYWLLRGRDGQGQRYLGLGRAGGDSLLIDVARHLRVPRGKVADALLEDLGWPLRSDAGRRAKKR